MARLITGLLVVAILVGGGLYLVSPWVKSKVDQHYQDLTQWTPEKIAADPVGYLRHATSEFDRIEKQLEGRKLALKTQKIEAERKLRDEDAYLPVATKKLEDLKGEYRTAETAGSFSEVKVNGATATQQQLRDLILEADRRIEASQLSREKYSEYISRVTSEIERTGNMLVDLREKRAEVQQKLEHVKLDQNAADYEALRDKVNAVLDTTRAISDKDPVRVSFDDLVKAEKESQAKQDQQERFDRIMEQR